MHQLAQTPLKTKGNPFFSAGLKKTEGISSLRLFSKQEEQPKSIALPPSYQDTGFRMTKKQFFFQYLKPKKANINPVSH